MFAVVGMIQGLLMILLFQAWLLVTLAEADLVALNTLVGWFWQRGSWVTILSLYTDLARQQRLVLSVIFSPSWAGRTCTGSRLRRSCAGREGGIIARHLCRLEKRAGGTKAIAARLSSDVDLPVPLGPTRASS